MFTIPLFASLAALALAHRIFIHQQPLGSIPKAHWSVGLTSLWMFWVRFRHRENYEVRQAHNRLGPLVRLGPNELSVNVVEGGLRTVYGKFGKHSWYRSFYNLSWPNLFSFEEFAPHSERRRALLRIYSKTSILNSEPLHAQNDMVLYGRLNGILQSHADSREPLEVFNTILATTMDVVTAFLFGLSHSSNFLLDEDERKLRLRQYQNRTPYAFYKEEAQPFWALLKCFGLSPIPKQVRMETEAFDQWIVDMCDASMRDVQASIISGKQRDLVDQMTVVSELSKGISQEGTIETTENRAEKARAIASEMVDHAIAGHETSGVALTYLIFELSRNPSLQTILRSELQPLFREAPPNSLPPFTQLDQLPFLHACILEILRLHPPVAGAQARLTPPGGTRLGDLPIPGGVRVSSRACCLHSNADVYPDPEAFVPSRWLHQNGKRVKTAAEEPEMFAWWWAFGSGGRMCLGNHFALHDMKIVAGLLYAGFTTTLVECGDMQQADAYIGPPKGGMLKVRLEKAE